MRGHARRMRHRSALVACLGLAALLGPVCAALAGPTPAPARLMQKHLVAIGGGRQLNLVCLGHGSPTLVFEYGFGSNLLHWQKIADEASQITRACFYDRAGYGYSSPPGRPSTAANAVADLHALLLRSRIKRPIVLVGHSLGGLYATLYADRYRHDVAGLVLVEPSFAEQDRDEDASQRAKDEVAFKSSTSQFRRCAALARSGRLASETHEECFAFAPSRTPEERSFLAYQMTRPDRYEAMASEAESQHSTDGKSDANSREERAAQRSFGNMPLIVMTAAEAVDPKASESDRAASSRLWLSWKAGHDRLAARSKRGRSVVIPGTGHFIQLEQPRAVIDAIKEVVVAARHGQVGH